MLAGYVSDAVIRRLPGYYRHLAELETAGVVQISSLELGKRMQLTPSQIRQDINCFGGFGRQGYGYDIVELKGHISDILGLNKKHRMIIIGAGNIGTAIVNFPSFFTEGFETIAVFDNDVNKIGKRIGGILIQPSDEIAGFIESNHVDIAVLAIHADGAQHTIDLLSQLQIKAIWNFTSTDLSAPHDMIIVNVHLSDSLQILSYKLNHQE